MQDDRDAWLDDVRRWYYGGTPPAGDRQREAPAAEAAAARRVQPATEPRIERKEPR